MDNGVISSPINLIQSSDANVVSDRVYGIVLQDGVNFGGQVKSSVNTLNDKFSFQQTEKGIRVRGHKCNKLVPWANLKDVDYYLDDGTAPVGGKVTT